MICLCYISIFVMSKASPVTYLFSFIVLLDSLLAGVAKSCMCCSLTWCSYIYLYPYVNEFLSIYIVIVYYKKDKIITNPPPPFDSNKQNLGRCRCGSIWAIKNLKSSLLQKVHSIDSSCFSSGSRLSVLTSSSGVRYASAIAFPFSRMSEGTVLRRLQLKKTSDFVNSESH